MMAFNLADYETVESRLHKFITDFPDFRVSTELESFQDGRFIVKAYIFRTYADGVAFSTGYAEETISDRGVNSTSALENCETSAIGRALANAGYATKGKRPSREEMGKVARAENDKKLEKITVAPVDSWETFTATMPETVESVTSDVLANLKESLGAEEVPQCVHGSRIKKQGTSKAGKPYLGWVCANGGGHVLGGVAPCDPIWYIYVSQTGTFRAPDQTE